MKTKVFIENFKGHDLFAIYEVDENDNKSKPTPYISFGVTKAIAITTHKSELEQFVKERMKTNIRANIDMTKLSPEEQNALQELMSKALK